MCKTFTIQSFDVRPTNRPFRIYVIVLCYCLWICIYIYTDSYNLCNVDTYHHISYIYTIYPRILPYIFSPTRHQRCQTGFKALADGRNCPGLWGGRARWGRMRDPFLDDWGATKRRIGPLKMETKKLQKWWSQGIFHGIIYSNIMG